MRETITTPMLRAPGPSTPPRRSMQAMIPALAAEASTVPASGRSRDGLPMQQQTEPQRHPALRCPPRARAAVLVVHPDATSRNNAGHAFVADVLHAHRYATLPFCLHGADEQMAGLAPPGMVQGKQRIRAALDALAAQPAVDGLPLVLIGLGDAVTRCAAAATRTKLPRLRSLVLLDGRADQVPHHLARLNLPTLFVLGRPNARLLALHRSATRGIAARHRTELLQQPTMPQPVRGALEAFACLAVAWLDGHLDAETACVAPQDGPSMAA